MALVIWTALSYKHTGIGSSAMADPMKRTILERFDVPDSNYETVIMHVEIAPLANTGLHTLICWMAI